MSNRFSLHCMDMDDVTERKPCKQSRANGGHVNNFCTVCRKMDVNQRESGLGAEIV